MPERDHLPPGVSDEQETEAVDGLVEAYVWAELCRMTGTLPEGLSENALHAMCASMATTFRFMPTVARDKAKAAVLRMTADQLARQRASTSN